MYALYDALGRRPASVMWTALLTMAVGGATLVCSSVLVTALVTSWPGLVFWGVAVVQLGAGGLLVVGGVRLVMGSGRWETAAGAALLYLTCGAYVLYAMTEVAGNPQDERLVPALLTIAGAFAAAGTGVLVLAMRVAGRTVVAR
jgi:hypothetical protein